jgi:type IV fimbrial biogenesis protein FimT
MLTGLSMQRGVSLIETMIGLVIVSLTLAVGAPSFSTFMQNTHIRNAAEAVQNGLSLARMEAVHRNTNVQFTLGAGGAWTIGCVTAVADLDGDGVVDCPATIQARAAAEGSSNATVALSEIVAATNAVAASPVITTQISFNGMGKVRTLPAGNNAVINISNPAGGTCAAAGGVMRCLRVVVSTGGQVRMCDPKLSVSNPSDPQAC